MIYLRSMLFMLVLLVVTPPYALFMIFCFPLPHRARRYTAVPWVFMTIWLIKHLLRIDYRLLGRENIPERPAVILSKHQSAWETVVLQEVFPLGLFVWKREIKWQLPFFGWALAVIPMISIDRGAGKNALKQLVDQGRLRLSQGYPVIIFPEGTRRPAGAEPRYKYGVAHLYAAEGVPCVPIALNSGLFWPRRSILRYPGTVIAEVLDPIPPGLSKDEFFQRLQDALEPATARLIAEAKTKDPNLGRDSDA